MAHREPGGAAGHEDAARDEADRRHGGERPGLAAEVGLRIVEQGFYDLDAPVARVCSEEVPIPYPKHLEDAALPSLERIVAAVRRLFSDAK